MTMFMEPPRTLYQRETVDTEPHLKREPMRILVVEDDSVVSDFLNELLTDEGYVVLHAANGLEALNVIDIRQPQLIISDVMMPELNGLDMWRRVRQGAIQQLPTMVFMSATATPSMVSDATLIEKPFDIDLMLQTVAEALHAVRSSQ